VVSSSISRHQLNLSYYLKKYTIEAFSLA